MAHVALEWSVLRLKMYGSMRGQVGKPELAVGTLTLPPLFPLQTGSGARHGGVLKLMMLLLLLLLLMIMERLCIPCAVIPQL